VGASPSGAVAGRRVAVRRGRRRVQGLPPRRGDRGEDAGERKGQVQDVVGGVDRQQPEHGVVEQAPHRDGAVGDAEEQRDRLRARAPHGRREQQTTRGDVDEVVPPVDLEHDEVRAVDVTAGPPRRVRDEAEHPGDEQPGARQQAVPLGRSPRCAAPPLVALPSDVRRHRHRRASGPDRDLPVGYPRTAARLRDRARG
jgi:hypothetical protein